MGFPGLIVEVNELPSLDLEHGAELFQAASHFQELVLSPRSRTAFRIQQVAAQQIVETVSQIVKDRPVQADREGVAFGTLAEVGANFSKVDLQAVQTVHHVPGEGGVFLPAGLRHLLEPEVDGGLGSVRLPRQGLHLFLQTANPSQIQAGGIVVTSPPIEIVGLVDDHHRRTAVPGKSALEADPGIVEVVVVAQHQIGFRKELHRQFKGTDLVLHRPLVNQIGGDDGEVRQAPPQAAAFQLAVEIPGEGAAGGMTADHVIGADLLLGPKDQAGEGPPRSALLHPRLIPQTQRVGDDTLLGGLGGQEEHRQAVAAAEAQGGKKRRHRLADARRGGNQKGPAGRQCLLDSLHQTVLTLAHAGIGEAQGRQASSLLLPQGASLQLRQDLAGPGFQKPLHGRPIRLHLQAVAAPIAAADDHQPAANSTGLTSLQPEMDVDLQLQQMGRNHRRVLLRFHRTQPRLDLLHHPALPVAIDAVQPALKGHPVSVDFELVAERDLSLIAGKKPGLGGLVLAMDFPAQLAAQVPQGNQVEASGAGRLRAEIAHAQRQTPLPRVELDRHVSRPFMKGSAPDS